LISPPPTVNAGPDLTIRQSTAIDATVTNGLIYAWTQVSGPLGGLAVFGSPASEDTTVTCTVEGVYVLRLTVINLIGTASDDVSVTWDVTAPAITQPADITAEATDGSGASVNFPAVVATDATPTTAVYAPPSGSVFPIGNTSVTVTVTDAAGNSSQSNFQVHVVDTSPPAISTSTNAAPNPGITGVAVAFACAASDASAVSWHWDFGDGSSDDSGASVSHAYAASGSYSAVVTATDSGGRSSSSSLMLSVQDPPAATPPPTGNGGGIGNAVPPKPLTVLKLTGGCRFDGSPGDTFLIKGMFAMPAGFNPGGTSAF
jgi:PKD repeat protein